LDNRPDEARIRNEELHILLNLSMVEVKELILKYKETKSSELFSLLVFRFEYFLLQMCFYFKRKFKSFLADEDIRELFNISVIALHKSLISMPVTWDSTQICLRIGSYLKIELLASYRVKIKEQSNISIEDMEWLEKNAVNYYTEDLREKLDEIRMIEDLRTEVDGFNILEEKYLNRVKFKDLYKKIGIPYWKSIKKVEEVLNKCRKYLAGKELRKKII